MKTTARIDLTTGTITKLLLRLSGPIAFSMLMVTLYGVIYLTIMSLGNVFVGTIMTMASVFQGLGKTYPSFYAAIFDNALFAALVFTLPGLFGWGIQSVWWIKLATAGIEMLIITYWLMYYLRRVLIWLRV